MKRALLIAIAMFCAVGVFAQGTVHFNNRLGGTSHVWGATADFAQHQIQGNGPGDNPPGSTSYAGCVLIGSVGPNGLYGAATTFTTLLGAPGANQPESSLLSAINTTTFRTGPAAGNNVEITCTFGNIPPDAPIATIQMVAWDNASGLYPTWALASVAWSAGLISAGRSAPFNLANIGGPGNTPPDLVGLTSFNIFNIIPEPSSIAILGFGAAVLAILRRRK